MSELSEELAWTWVEHLRSGGSTSWRQWQADGRATPRAVPTPRWPVLPSAAHLALTRRLAESGASTSVADLVLTTPAAGRGQPELSLGRLTGAGRQPEDLPARELLRVAVPALARAAAAWEPALASGERLGPRVPRWRWPGARGYQVVGSSPLADEVRAALRCSRLREGGRRPTVLVVGGPLDAMMSGLWRHRVLAGAGLRWRRVWAAARARDALPGGTDLVRVVNEQIAGVDGDRVHLLLGRSIESLLDLAGQVLGAAVTEAATEAAQAAAPDMVTTDLLRRVNQVTVMRLPASRRRQVCCVIDALAPSHDVPVLGVPPAHLGWAKGKAVELGAALREVGCVVHGDPASVVPSTGGELPHGVRAEQTLAVAQQTLVRLPWGGDRWRAR